MTEPAYHVAIEELVLRVPGVRPDDAAALIEEVLARVQDNLRGSGRIGRVQLTELQIRVPEGAGRAALVTHLADGLTEALR